MALTIPTPARRGSFFVRSIEPDMTEGVFRFETNSTGNPDGLLPTAGITMARTATGTITATFASNVAPVEMVHVDLRIEEASPTITLYCTGYASQALTFKMYTSGTIADSADKTITCRFLGTYGTSFTA